MLRYWYDMIVSLSPRLSRNQNRPCGAVDSAFLGVESIFSSDIDDRLLKLQLIIDRLHPQEASELLKSRPCGQFLNERMFEGNAAGRFWDMIEERVKNG